ncbi:MAG TPA: hypothetical protein VG708_13550 [Mycobacteriales bacterium]|nr:hypothetical protein [Mycobacteriales bacterium]
MSTRRPVTGVLLMLLGAWAAILPYVGPAFGYRMTAAGSWTWTASAWELHLAAGALVLVGGMMLVLSRWGSTAIGAWCAIVGGVWIVLGPLFASLWLPVTSSETQVFSSTLNDAARPLGYHYGTGLLIVLIAAYVLGRASVLGRAGRMVEAAAAGGATGAATTRDREPVDLRDGAPTAYPSDVDGAPAERPTATTTRHRA